jgi:hypothetical protein
MSLRRVVACAVVCAAVLLFTPRGLADELLITAGSAWKYNDTGADLGTAWQAPGFNDTAWPSGLAQLGYGDGDEVTIVGFGGNTANRYITTYFRRSFTVSSPASISALVLRVVRDDGCVIYINGTEVARSNMPAGTISSTTPATTAIGGADESAWIEIPLAPSVLVAGANIIAVELHQQSPTSTDISFNLELRAVPAPVPSVSVSLASPPNQSVVNSTSVTFTASASAAAGLSTATLQVGGTPRTAVFSGPALVEDTQITADTPTASAGDAPSINIDGQTPHAHGLIKFPALVGTGGGQVPAGSIVTSATLQVNCTNFGQTLQLYRLTQNWTEDEATWTERAAGVTWASAGAEGASNAGVAVPGDCTTTGLRLIDLTRFVQEWTDGAPNFGLVLTDTGTDGVDFDSSESATSPVLTVTFKDRLVPVETQPLTGVDALVSFTVNLTLGQTYFWNVEVTDANGTVNRAATDFEVTLDAAAPDLPVLVSPANGALGVDLAPSLVATVTNPNGGVLNASVHLRKATAPEFTIIVLPDTQFYSESFPSIFTTQTQWIVDQKASRNIVFVTHEGDIVNVNSNTTQWQRANTSMSLLDGVVPYGMGPGNHDQPTTLYNQTFPFTRYQNQPWYGGHYQNLNDNNYQLFSGGGMDFVIVHLEFCPPAGAVSWAQSVLASNPNRIGIMTTHGYLNESAQRTVGGCSSTQYLWDGLALTSPNLHFMLSGHVHDESRRTDTANGHPVFQLMADYQARASGGEGWLRIMRFVPAEDKIYVQTYSPWLNRYETDANSEFTLDFPMSTPFVNVGAVNVPSGENAAVAAGSLEPSTPYEWQMTVTNSSGRSRVGPTWTFTTGSPPPPVNAAPTVATPAAAAPNPVIGTTTTLSALGADDAGEAGLTYTWATTGTPPAAVTFSANGTNVAKTTTATFTAAGSYTVQVTIRDAGNLTVTSSVSVTVTPVPPPVTVGYVQGASVTFPGSAEAASIARAFTSTNTAGNLIVVAVSWDGTASVSCADTLGNTYALAATHHDSTNKQSLAICYAANINAGANTITATFSASSSWRRMLIHEYRGLATASPVDVVAKNVANATTAANAVTSTAGVTTVAGDLIFGAVMDDSGPTTITAGTGFTQRLSVNNMDLASEDLVQPAAGSIAATHTFAAANRYLAIMVAFKPGGPANAAPTVATPAAATPAPVLGTTTTLTALGADDSGEAGLTYTWATTGTPPAAVTFSANGTNAAKTTTATFTRAGSYTFQVTIRDAGNLTVTSNIGVTVTQTVTAITVTPASAAVVTSATQAFAGSAVDQFGQALAPQPAFTWSVTGGGTIGAAGLFTAGATAGGPFTVTAANAGKTGTANVTVTTPPQGPGIAYVQGATMTFVGDSAGINISRAFTTANTAGNLIVVAVSWDSNSTVSCADTQGNVYSIAVSNFDSTNRQSLAVCYAANVKAGPNTVTATFSSSSSWRRMLIHEYSGVALVNPVDVVAKNVANGTTSPNAITSTAAVTAANGDLIFGAVMDDAGTTTVTAGTGFAQRLSVNNKDLVSEDLIQATAGSIAATHTFGAAHRYLALMVAFRRQ